MSSSTPVQNRPTVGLIRQKFERVSGSRDDAVTKPRMRNDVADVKPKLTRSISASQLKGEFPRPSNVSRRTEWRLDGSASGAPQAKVTHHGGDPPWLRRKPSASSMMGPEKPKVLPLSIYSPSKTKADSNGKVAVHSVATFTKYPPNPSAIQASRNAANNTGTTGIKPKPILKRGAKPEPGPKPSLPSKPRIVTNMPSRSLSIGTPQAAKENRTMRSAQGSEGPLDPEAQIGSPRPDDDKPRSVAERTRIFSAEEPSSSTRGQRRQQAEGAGPAGLACFQWESGEQGDDEGDPSDKLSRAGRPTFQLDPRCKREGSSFGNQGAEGALKGIDPRGGRKLQARDRDVPGSSSGHQTRIPKWLRKGIERIKSSGRNKASQPVEKSTDSLPLEDSESVYSNVTQDSRPMEGPDVLLHDTSMKSAEASPKVPKSVGEASRLMLGQQIQEHPQRGSSEVSANASTCVGGACHQGISPQQTLQVHVHPDGAGSLRRHPKFPVPVPDAPVKDASYECQNKEKLLPCQLDESTDMERRTGKPLPDIPQTTPAFIDIQLEEKPLKVVPHQEQAHPKPLPKVPEKGTSFGGEDKAVNQSPKFTRSNSNQPSSGNWKTTKPLPKVPAKDVPSIIVGPRPGESLTKFPDPATKLLSSSSFPQKAKATPTCQPLQNQASVASDRTAEAQEPAEKILSEDSHSNMPKSKSLKRNTMTFGMQKAVGPLPGTDQTTEGHCCPAPKPAERYLFHFGTTKVLPDFPLSCDNMVATRAAQRARKHLPVASQTRWPVAKTLEECFSKPLPKVPEEERLEAPEASKPRPRVPRQRKKDVAPSRESPAAAQASGSPDEFKQTLGMNTDQAHGVIGSADSAQSLSSGDPDKATVPSDGDQPSTSHGKVTAENKQHIDAGQPKLSDASSVDVTTDNNTSQPTCASSKDIVQTDSGSDNSDNEWGTYDINAGSDSEGASTFKSRVIPLRPNKLLQQQQCEEDEATGDYGGLRRTSSLEEMPAITLGFTNARGLFQRAQQLKASEPTDESAKPPIPQKPKILKKPTQGDGPGSITNRPGTAPKITNTSPTRTIASSSPTKYSPPTSAKPAMDTSNIYDEVCPDPLPQSNLAGADQDKSSQRKLEKILGPDFVSVDQTGPSTSTQKGKPPDTWRRKISEPSRPTTDGEGPYAVIPLPDADKTATKKTKPPVEQKPRKISDGNGNAVVLRNSGGMSSGDSGIVGLHHDDTLEDKRGIRRKERRMSRRLLRRTMKSLDSDFTEDSDDEPIGADSDFDSDSSLEEPTEFSDESHKKAFEVLTTERTYVDTLSLISQIFLTRIREESQKQHWFPSTVLNEIFSNITSIYQLHSAVLLPELEKRLKEWEKNPCLGEVLKKVAPFLKLYSDYVSNFDNAMKQLNQWTSKVPKFAATLSEMQKLPQCGNLALQHHMLTPVQRIPRYELLLKEYLRKLPEDARDRPDAERALDIISAAAQHSNDMMKSMEQFEKLLKINEKIDGENIIDPTRHLLKEGKMTKISAKNKEQQDRYIFLFNDILLCCERKRLLTSANYKVKMKLGVDGMKVLDSSSCRFIIESKNKSIEFQTSSEEEREEWMAVLLSAIREMVWKKETFRTNDAVGDRQNGVGEDDKTKFAPGKSEPRWIRDDETSMCMRCGTEFKLTRRRHHCRSCGAVVCNRCSNFEAPLEYDDNKVNKVCNKCYFTVTGDDEELEKLVRRSLIDVDDESSFGSYLFVYLRGSWVRFWVIVTEQDLFALKAPKDVRPVLTLPLKKYSVRDIDNEDSDRDNVFKLFDGGMIYSLSAESAELKRKWLSVLVHGVQDVVRKSQTL